MTYFENAANAKSQLTIRRQFARLRLRVHRSMKLEEGTRMRERPRPTEQELYMGAFKEWLEPQVRAAVVEMNKKGYATQSSGFHGTKCELQMIDGLFTIDESTKNALHSMGVEVLRGADIGLPKNKVITIIRFRATDHPSINKMSIQWDAVAAVLPEKSFPREIRSISDQAETFREQYAPEHSSLEETRKAYFEYVKKITE
jgi:hypothetical protein